MTIGPIPSSIHVPLCEACIILQYYKGSDPTFFCIPYRGSYEHIRNMNKVMAVYRNLSLKDTLLSAYSTSGRIDRKGRTRFKTLNSPFMMPADFCNTWLNFTYYIFLKWFIWFMDTIYSFPYLLEVIEHKVRYLSSNKFDRTEYVLFGSNLFPKCSNIFLP